LQMYESFLEPPNNGDRRQECGLDNYPSPLKYYLLGRTTNTLSSLDS